MSSIVTIQCGSFDAREIAALTRRDTFGGFHLRIFFKAGGEYAYTYDVNDGVISDEVREAAQKDYNALLTAWEKVSDDT